MTFGFPHSRNGSEYANDPEETFDEWAERMATADRADRDEFPSGMVRSASAGRPRFDLLYPENVPYSEQFVTRMAKRMAEGAKSYGDRNWEKAHTAEELARAIESTSRHYAAWMAGDTEEDHAAALAVNLLFAETIRHKLSV